MQRNAVLYKALGWLAGWLTYAKLRRGARGLALLCLPLVLSGCLRYDLTLRFDHHRHGQLVQTVDLSDRAAALAQPTPWLADLRTRSQAVGGHIRQRDTTVTLTVPFGTPDDLVRRYRQLFANPATAAETGAETGAEADLGPDGETHAGPLALVLPGWGTVPAALSLDQRNWGLATRTHLTYRVDLSELPPNGDRGDAPWADLRLRLQVPWGLTVPPAPPPLSTTATEAVWALVPGQITDIEASFWLPNPLGLGSGAIALLVLVGYALRYGVSKPPG